MKNIIIFTIAILTTGCTVQTQPQTPKVMAPAEEDSPCLDAIKASAGRAYDATKEAIKESSEDGLIKKADDKYEELKERAGKAYDSFMEED